MKLSEAIEIQENINKLPPSWTPDLGRQASNLGIEAMKLLISIRERNICNPHKLLPGETEEQ